MNPTRNTDIRSLFLPELESILCERGEPQYRARQLYTWLHDRDAEGYGEMTDLPKALREKLEAAFPLRAPETLQVQTSALDGTQKYLFALGDGNVIESVRMRYRHGVSVCVSTQVGCRMGCRFCASTLDGRVRDLTAGEMLGQVSRIRKATGERVSHVVLMGSGEPLDNYEQVLRFIRLLSAPGTNQISQRNITLSTCGLVPEIRRLAEEELAITLAISLHAATDEKRRTIMPVARRYGLDELMAACTDYFEKTGRRVSFEYALIAGENDSEEDARLLAQLLKPQHGHLNLIPVNRVRERNYRRPTASTIVNFHKKLEKYGINVTIRREMGPDIDGACGQLRKRYIETDQENQE